MLVSQRLFRGVCFAVFASQGLFPGGYFQSFTTEILLRIFRKGSSSLRVSNFACTGTEVEGLLGHQFGAVA